MIRVEEGKLAQGPMVQTGAYTYDGNGRLLSFEDGNSNRHLYSYDAAGRLLEVLRQGQGAPSASPYVSYSYQGPWVTEMREGSSTAPWKVQWDYDALGRTTTKRVKQENLPSSDYAKYTWTWDGSGPTQWIGVRHKTGDPSGATRYFYDESAPWGDLGRLTTVERDPLEVGAATLAFEYDYDFEGNTIATTWPSGAEVHSTYADGWKTTDTVYLPNPAVQGATSIAYSYHPNWGTLGQWVAETGAKDWKTTFTRATPNRMTQMRLFYGSTTKARGFYGYEPNGWLQSKRIAPMMSTSDFLYYEYDDLGRAEAVRNTATGHAYETYGYDDAGNLTSFVQGTPGVQKTWTYGAPSKFGEIPWRTDGTTTDAHVWNGTTGRLSEWNTTASGVPSILRDFSYDSAGRLVEIARTEGASTLTTALYYDVDDQLVQEDRGSDTYFRFQGHRTSPTGEQTESVLPQIRVYTAPSGQQHLRFAYIDVDGQAVHVYAQGGAVMATDVTGIYGVPLQGAPGDYTVTPGNWELDGLHGQEEDRTNEVMHFGARHTMFRDGMWMQPEPHLSTALVEVVNPLLSASQYGAGNPIRFEDLSGWEPATYNQIKGAPESIEFDEDQTLALTETLGNGILAGLDEGTALITSENGPDAPLTVTPGEPMPSGSPMMLAFSEDGGLIDQRGDSALPVGGAHTHPKAAGYVQAGFSPGDLGPNGTDRATARRAKATQNAPVGMSVVMAEAPLDDGSFRVDVAITSGDTRSFYVGKLNVDQSTLTVDRVSSKPVRR
ncbi:MAG: hypothetical protein R3F61_06470 [Myxococcota bacterium]